MKVDTSFTIDGQIVEFFQDLGKNIKVYYNSDCVSPVFYITKEDKVIIKFSGYVSGDDMSCLTDCQFESFF